MGIDFKTKFTMGNTYSKSPCCWGPSAQVEMFEEFAAMKELKSVDEVLKKIDEIIKAQTPTLAKWDHQHIKYGGLACPGEICGTNLVGLADLNNEVKNWAYRGEISWEAEDFLNIEAKFCLSVANDPEMVHWILYENKLAKSVNPDRQWAMLRIDDLKDRDRFGDFVTVTSEEVEAYRGMWENPDDLN